MLAERYHLSYWGGVQRAFAISTISTLFCSMGFFSVIWIWTRFDMSYLHEDLRVWVPVVWLGSLIGFMLALIPNYLMVRKGRICGGI
jgi:hypothetical protein